MKITFQKSLIRLLRPFVVPAFIGLAVLATTLLFAGEAMAASPGALDLSFGLRGTSAFTFGTMSEESRALAIQSDGKVVIAGAACIGSPCSSSNFVVVRFNADGTLDNGFGTNGAVVTDFSGEHEWAQAIAIQADGKIVVAGGTIRTTMPAGFKLVRYLSDGTLDSDFGTGGKVFENFDNAGGTAFSVFVQPDGKIVAAGTDENSTLFVARFNSNGGLDTGFGTNGRIATNAYSVLQVRMVPQSDGKIVIAASALPTFPTGTLKLIRFNANGTPDNDFGVSGVATSTVTGGFVPAVAIQTDGKILVSGAYSDSQTRVPLLRRFNQDGNVDGGLVPDFGEIDGEAGCLSCTNKPAKVLLLADGRFYLVGTHMRYNSSVRTPAVTRYLSSGSIDWSFGFRGVSYFRHTNGFPSGTNQLNSVGDALLQADGKIVIAATGSIPVTNNPRPNFLAIRLNVAVTPPSLPSDFDGDGKTDFAVFRPSDQYWYALRSSDNSLYAALWGVSGDVIVPGDYNYDRKTDLAIFRPANSGWSISPSQPTFGGNPGGLFGQSGDISMPEDFDGDGRTDLATYRPANGTWNIRYSSRILNINYPTADVSFPFGNSTDKPVAADYDGDGRADLAVYRPSEGRWYILRTSDGLVTNVHFGLSTDKTVQGDYDGDLKTDIAVYRDGAWYILRSSDGGFVGIAWGLAADKPVPGDYDGDGKYDVAVYRPSGGVWYVLRSSDSVVAYAYWGISEDIPIPNAFVR